VLVGVAAAAVVVIKAVRVAALMCLALRQLMAMGSEGQVVLLMELQQLGGVTGMV
jgi:hypothetical protein